MRAMDEETMRQRVGEARVGRLGTVTGDGRPHLVPCCFALDVQRDGDVVYSAVDAKPKSTLALRRLANLRANGAAALLVDHYDEDWSALWWVRVDGQGRVIESGPERERALDLLSAKYDQYRRQRPEGAVVAIDTIAWRSWP
jgi:PPOX class probable F420-dependent enzyme